MIKSGYQEGLYCQEGLPIPLDEAGAEIRALLRENHGVGILGGTYDPGHPICMVSELTMQMLGYATAEAFQAVTGGTMAGLIVEGSYDEAAFSALSGTCELYLQGQTGHLWVRMVKRDITASGGQRLWLASVCDMDALYQKELEVDQLLQDKRRQELTQQAKLAQANAELERQKAALEQALSAAELNNQIISAIGKIYWLIYRLDLQDGTFEEISTNGGLHRPTGDCGLTAQRFPEACRQTVAPSFQAAMLAFLDTTTLAERLQGRNELSAEYETITGNWHSGRFIVQARDPAGRAVKVLYTIQIITEQKRRELEYEQRLAQSVEEAQRANLSKTDFLRRMSHDIRTPINGIQGMLEIAEHYQNDPEKLKECRQKVREASGYLLSLVNSVLDMNKLESGAVVLLHDPFDLQQLLNEANSIAEAQASEHGLRYIIDREHQSILHPHLLGSPGHIKQVLMNLAGNAVKYNKEHGSITVCCQELSCDGVSALFRFTCSDTGIGMSPEFQKTAFEPFSQEGRNDARTRYDGSGLGLSIVKALVEQMGGSIDLTSEVGVGTTFSVILPFQIDPDPQPDQIPEAPAAPVDLTDKTILLVEDNELNLEIAQFFLEQHGARVVVARNGQEAVDSFTASVPCTFVAILMDVMMPVMDGYEATAAIRSSGRPDAKTVPIIAMSANAFQDDIRKSRTVGMDDHLSKPLDAQKLLAAIRRHIRQ